MRDYVTIILVALGRGKISATAFANPNAVGDRTRGAALVSEKRIRTPAWPPARTGMGIAIRGPMDVGFALSLGVELF